MIPLIADEDFNNHVVRGVIRRNQQIDFLRVQDVGLSGAADPAVLAWAAEQGRMLVTRDVSTMSRHAIHRVESGLPMPGIIECPQALAIGTAIDQILLIAACSQPDEWRNQILYLPL